MTTPLGSIGLFLVASVFGAIGQFFYKSGAESANGGLFSYVLNVRIFVGVFCYLAVTALTITAFKRGGSLAALYPVYATTFIWAALIALYAYGTPIRPVNAAGMGLLVAGMYCMGR